MAQLLSLAEPVEPVLATTPGGTVYQRFEREPDVLALAVVDADGRPVGIVERNTFFLRMAAEYGRALYAQRPIAMLMNAEALVVEGDVGLMVFTREVLAERPSELMQGFIVVQDGLYAGIGSALSLLQATSRANRDHALEMTKLADTLKAAQVEAQAALQAKSKFLAVMSHEIRTPLNGVLTVADILSRRLNQGELKPPELRPYVQTILDSGQTLLRLLTDALDFSRADAGHLELQQEPFCVSALVGDVAGLWTAPAVDKGLAFDVAYAGPDDLWALGDEVRLKQVFNNLIGNAIKFTDRGGVRLRLIAERDDVYVRLCAEVADTGPGVGDDRLPHIFHPFVQEDAGRAKGGAGLGLAICRELVERMDGQIQASHTPGGGLTVAFETTAFHVPGEPHAAPAEVAALEAEPVLSAHVLIADDNATNRMVAETLCGMFGCTSQSVADGAEAVDAVRSGVFDLILMDIKMPLMDGLEASRRIRALQGPASQAPIVALTANADPWDAAEYLDAGMDAVVEKPIRPAALLAAMTTAVESRNRRADKPVSGVA
jgi:signal transduction histidine kinase/ActR/RegA family two-component response regulator